MKFTVIGLPKAQPRTKARHFETKAGRDITSVYTPATAKSWKALVAIAAQAQPEFPAAPWTGPVALYVNTYLPRPKRLFRKKDPDGPLWAPSKGRNDVDNLLKSVMDALSDGGLWQDDGQVVIGLEAKMYHEKDRGPRAVVAVAEIDYQPVRRED